MSTDRIDSRLSAEVRRVQEEREAADYDAREVSPDDASEIVRLAEGFVDAVAAMLEG